MASSRRATNGRSPLVRKQSQITTFFSPGKTPKGSPSPNPSPSPSPSPSPNPNPKPSPKCTPLPPQSKSAKKKTPLFIPPSPASNLPSTAVPSEVVGRRLRVFLPPDGTWHEGRVKSLSLASGKHLIQFDDAEEKELILGNEKIEWVEEEPPRVLRRLRRMSDSVPAAAHIKNEIEDVSVGDDDDDGDYCAEGDSEEVVPEEEEDELLSSRSRRVGTTSAESRKRKKKKIAAETLSSIKKVKFDGDLGEKSGPPKTTPQSKNRSSSGGSVSAVDRVESLDISDPALTADAAERFGRREAVKFRFLGIGRKDANGRRPQDAEYDPRTLFLPQDFLKSLSGGQKQWWKFKSKHMDKVLFFKMGKFYELFEMDAHIGARELDLQYMKGEQPHCGFPEKNFSMNLEKLAIKGYRVLVVEQTETPKQLELRRREMGSKDTVVKREVCAMVTKGTLTEGESLLTNPDASYLMSITENCQFSCEQKKETTFIGICVVDVSTGLFMVGQFEDDSDRHCLCSILAELRPVEIIKPSKVLSPETERVLKNHTRNPLVNDLVPSVQFWDAERTIDEISNTYMLSGHSLTPGQSNGDISVDNDSMGKGSSGLPGVLTVLQSAGPNGYYALSALGGCLFYLRQAFLDKPLLKYAKFEPLPCLGFLDNLQKRYMVLDAAALENLEILENNINGGPSGTLFAQLDRCVTAFGKRLLKCWLARPLYELRHIIKRQDAIASFKGPGLDYALEFRAVLSRIPDMERLLARVFSSCDANGRNANRVTLYEDAAKKQLQGFLAALHGCQVMLKACASLNSVLSSTDSSLLHHLLTPGEGLPDMSSVLKYFKDAFDWSEAEHNGRIIPHEGGDIEYDTACKTVKEIESKLIKYLKEQRKLLGDTSINYVTVGKELYLLEVPESLSAAVPKDYELRSSRKGFFRYWSPKIKKYLLELSQAEDDKESQLKGILQRLIMHFSEHHSMWRRLVSVTAELDVLSALAITGDCYEGPSCRPTIKERCHSSDAVPSLSAKRLGHPVLSTEVLGKNSFVPNDITIGGEGHASFILITGPNMGGKSTLLRQLCLAVILSQIGADVPAESFELSLVDRIFVRMGARDNIMSGQSTFFNELSETASMLSGATRNSFVALDELGRGTSTSDGQAIAGSVLEYFVREIQCRGLFSTHYHRLAVDYEKNEKVCLCHMGCQVGKGSGDMEEVTFLYRLTPGSCPKSYGANVARLAGIPSSVLQKAIAKSSEFEASYGKQRLGFKRKPTGGLGVDAAALLQKVLHMSESWNHHEDSHAINLSLLSEMQQRASLLSC